MKRFLLSTLMVVIGLTAFSQSPSRLINLTSAYPIAVGENTVDGVTLSCNALYIQDIVLDSLERYEIGYIDTQTVRYSEEGHGFYVTADSLHSLNVVYSIEVENPPLGTIEFNETTGRFKYYPTEDDHQSFTVTFTATNGEESVTEDVEFCIMPKVLSEADAFRSTGTMPDAGDYITVAVTSKSMQLNNEERMARSISISGKDVIFDDAVQNKVWGLSGCDDIYELNIYAERLIVRSALTFPQANITVYARELIFEDKGGVTASINTTPKAIETLADSAGIKGADAGNITLFINSVKGDMAKRLILIGAKGQKTNRNGTPGNGGNGGMVTSNVDVSSFCDYARGSGGVKYDIAADGSTTAGPVIDNGLPGKSGSFKLVNKPNAYLHPYYISAVVRHAKDAFINNYTAFTLETCRDYYNLIDNYLAPTSTEEEEDGIHEGVINEVENTLGSSRSSTADLIEDLIDDGSGYEAPDRLELQNTMIELNDMLYRLEQGLDYFGNPVGWVPLLSFESYLANYENEVSRAIPTLYLYHWLNNIDQSLQHYVEASMKAADITEQEMDEYFAYLNTLILEVPILQDEANDINESIQNLTARLEKLQKQLLRKAKHNVKKRNRIKKIFGIVKTVANVLPVTGPVGAAIGAGLDVAVSVANNFSKFASFGDLSEFYTEISGEQYKTSSADMKAYWTSLKTGVSQNNLKTIKDAGENFSKALTPIAKSLGNLQKILSKSSSPSSQVQAEYNRLMANSKTWKKMKGEIDVLNTKKEQLVNHMNDVFANMTTTATDISNSALAYDAFKRDAFTGNSKRDLNAMIYFEKMEQRAKSRLLKYDYYLRKAYEYRLLKPYEGEEFNLPAMFERAEKLGMAIDSAIHEADYATLSSVFKERVSDMTAKIIEEYTNSHPERSSKISLVISKDQLDAINDNGSFTLNLYDMGVFSPDADNIRIVDLGVKYIKGHAEGEVGYYGHLDVDMEHSGYSQFRKDGHTYWFNHSTYGAVNPHTWRTTIDVNDLPEVKDPEIDHSSAAISSLMSAILKNNTENIMLFSRPSAWSDISVSKQVVTNWGADIVIDSLVLSLQYDYTRRANDVASIEVTANEELAPYFTCSVEDLDGRSNGNGHLSRSFKKNSQKVTFTATDKYETYYFVNWTDRAGRVVSDKAALTVNRSTDQFYRANYERRVPILGIPDSIRVSNTGGTYTVPVSNIGKGDTAMDWYVEDSLSTGGWIELNGIQSGIDAGSFTFSVKANSSGVDRVDSLEIFAPETDEMSKVIVVLQTNTQLKGDVNLDGQVGIGDIVAITNFMAGKPGNVTFERADVNGDGDVGIGDIVAVTNIMAGNSAAARRR